MAFHDVRAKVTHWDDFDMPSRVKIQEQGLHGRWHDAGAAFFVENDGLADIYAVVFEGHEIGTVEAYGSRVLAFADDDIPDYQKVVNAVARVV